MIRCSKNRYALWIASIVRALFGLAFALLALQANAAAPDSPIQAASEYDYPPFSIVTKDGQADGFSVELLREALSAVGRDVQFKVGPWHVLKQELAEGRIQALPLVGRNAARQLVYDFSAPYMSMHGTLVVRKGDSHIRGLEDLRGKTLVVLKGDNAEEYAREHGLTDKIATTETLEAGLRQLAAGQHDAMLVQKLAGESLIRTLGLFNLETVGPPIEHFQEFCFAVRSGDKELLAMLNEGLALIIANGTVESLREKWIAPTHAEVYANLRHNLAIVLGVLLLGGLPAYLVHRSRLAEVNRRSAQLAESEERYRSANTFLEVTGSIAKIGGWSLETETQTLRWTEETYRLHELDPREPVTVEQAIGFYAPTARPIISAAVQECIKKGCSFDLELPLVTASGKPKWVRAQGQAEQIDGKTVRLTGAFQDITERKRLDAERERLLNIIEDATDFISTSDMQGHIRSINAAGIRMVGLPDGVDIASMDIKDFHPEWAIRRISEEAIPTVLKKGSWQGESALLHRDGHEIPTSQMVLVHRDDLGQPLYMSTIIRDMTERKQAEEQLITITKAVDSASDAIGISDAQGHHFYQNQAMSDLFGYASAEELEAAGGGPVVIRDPEVAKDMFENIMSGRSWARELEMVTKNGRVFPAYERADAIKDHEGKIIGLVGIITDITERKRDEAELLRSNAELEMFGYAISHDLRQPLRMISSYMHLLENAISSKLDSEQREYFNFAIEGAKRMDTMMVALLEYSRVGRKGEPPAWVESRAVLDEALLYLQPAIAETQAAVRIQGDWPRVLVSPDEILRLIQNLIGNALKFRVAGRIPEILVTSEIVSKEWRMCVADNGIGILPDQIGRLFHVFQRLQSRLDYEGNGIGLAICRKIAEHHGGKICVESAGEGQGSRFCVALPQKAISPTRSKP